MLDIISHWVIDFDGSCQSIWLLVALVFHVGAWLVTSSDHDIELVSSLRELRAS